MAPRKFNVSIGKRAAREGSVSESESRPFIQILRKEGNGEERGLQYRSGVLGDARGFRLKWNFVCYATCYGNGVVGVYFSSGHL